MPGCVHISYTTPKLHVPPWNFTHTALGVTARCCSRACPCPSTPSCSRGNFAHCCLHCLRCFRPAGDPCQGDPPSSDHCAVLRCWQRLPGSCPIYLRSILPCRVTSMTTCPVLCCADGYTVVWLLLLLLLLKSICTASFAVHTIHLQPQTRQPGFSANR